jgi:Sec-independent protein secretion pathway component TatC
MNFINNLYEIRWRMIYLLFTAILSFSTSYIYKQELLYVFSLPLSRVGILENASINDSFIYIYTNLIEAFMTYLKMSLVRRFIDYISNGNLSSLVFFSTWFLL